MSCVLQASCHLSTLHIDLVPEHCCAVHSAATRHGKAVVGMHDRPKRSKAVNSTEALNSGDLTVAEEAARASLEVDLAQIQVGQACHACTKGLLLCAASILLLRLHFEVVA